ncbi:NUDIX hydrolase [Flagellimonas algicola]|uniref:NUDIX domain-containing protein n=1 Tax=Flagellimonas algicola TaxID=2583815 RepID=A0ABY2WQ29_9FLAO|nr:NUDIX domain-containing protein [Allomuricauda algicola]TMU56857.1 NUDIX domain-containing protein [Allomuricauda algicola]
MDELVDILDENGKLTGKTCLKSEAHRKGYFHPTIHVWFYTSDGKVLFQKRGANKDTFPGLWDVSVAGHIGAGEDVIEAAIREVEEEISLVIKPKDLEKIGCFKSVHEHSKVLVDKEFHHTFLCEMKIPLPKLIKQESEVDALELIDLTTFKFNVEHNQLAGFVPNDSGYYTKIIEEISQRL